MEYGGRDRPGYPLSRPSMLTPVLATVVRAVAAAGRVSGPGRSPLYA
jgi:hypothetical protein